MFALSITEQLHDEADRWKINRKIIDYSHQNYLSKVKINLPHPKFHTINKILKWVLVIEKLFLQASSTCITIFLVSNWNATMRGLLVLCLQIPCSGLKPSLHNGNSKPHTRFLPLYISARFVGRDSKGLKLAWKLAGCNLAATANICALLVNDLAKGKFAFVYQHASPRQIDPN